MLLEWIVKRILLLRWIESGTELDFTDQSFLSTGQLTDHSYPSSAYDSSTVGPLLQLEGSRIYTLSLLHL